MLKLQMAFSSSYPIFNWSENSNV